MMPKMLQTLGTALAGAALLAVAAARPAHADALDAALQAQLQAIAAQSGGTLGVYAHDLRSGRTASLNGSARFQLASTYKIPIALAILDAVDRGRLRLDQQVEIREADLAPGVSAIVEEWNPGEKRTIESLLRSMLVESDNTASDVLMTAAGGAAQVTGRLRALGIADFDVNRRESEIGTDFHGVAFGADHDLGKFADAVRDAPRDVRVASAERFMKDQRDTATPLAMGALLEKIAAGKAASADSTARLRALLRESRSPAPRLTGGLPEGTSLEHKTGTCADAFDFNCTNDVGIVNPPPGDAIVIAVFLKNSTKEYAERNRTLAEVTRAVYEAWTR